MAEVKKNKKTISGLVISNKMDKTIVVQSERLVQHKLYKKYIRRRLKFMADDQNNSCDIGDLVLIEECRPLSKMKRWRLKEILEKVA
jgi:small subunit ribosomal protein S17